MRIDPSVRQPFAPAGTGNTQARRPPVIQHWPADQVTFSGKRNRSERSESPEPPSPKAARSNDGEPVVRTLDEIQQLEKTNPAGMSGLMIAAETGNLEAAEALLRDDRIQQSINQVDCHGKTALHHAVEQNHLPLIALLLRYEAQKNILDEGHHTPITRAAALNNVDALRLLCKTEEDVNPVPPGGSIRFPLNEAVENDQAEAAAFLLAQGASVDNDRGRFNLYGEAYNQGVTPLMLAASNNNPKLLDLLLEHGAEPELKDDAHKTALAYAAGEGHWETTRKLLEKNANTKNAEDALERMLTQAAEKDEPEKLRFLLRHGVKPDLESRARQAVFYRALQKVAKRNDLETARLLLNSGLHPQPEREESPALVLAAEKGHSRMVKLLLAGDADVDAPIQSSGPREGRTALHAAARNNDEALAQDLIRAGADMEKADADGRTAFTHAVETGHNELAKKLHNRFGALMDWEFAEDSVTVTPMMAAADAGNEAMIDFMLDRNVNPGEPNMNGVTPLMNARNRSVALKLMQAGADVDAQDADLKTPLMYHSARGSTDIMEFLIQRGADVNATNDDEETALLLAVLANESEAVKLLLRRGANVDHADMVNDTALINAVSQTWENEGAAKAYQVQIIKELLDHGANVNHFNEDRQNALMLAAEYLLPECVEVLLARGGRMASPAHEAPSALTLAINTIRKTGLSEDGQKTLRLLIQANPEQARNNSDLGHLLKEYARGANPGLPKSSRAGVSKENQRRHWEKRFDKLRRLIEAGVNPRLAEPEIFTPLAYAARFNDPEGVELLVKNGVDPDGLHRFRHTALMHAARNGSTRAADVLLEYGADPNRFTSTIEKDTPFILAAQQGCVNTMLRLLQAGADPAPHINIGDETGGEATDEMEIDAEDQVMTESDDTASTVSTVLLNPPVNRSEMAMSWPVKLARPEVAEYVQSLLGTNHPDKKITWNLQTRNRQQQRRQEAFDRARDDFERTRNKQE